MTDLYVSVGGESGGAVPGEGGPHTMAELKIQGETVAHWDGSAWYIDNGGAFGNWALTGTTWPIILGQAK